ncbi:hypothetical protein J6590_077340 [Homalodisca vitripennis]|nr:hypothetical protein J6590_077340 [Homalodisca vitripennis]
MVCTKCSKEFSNPTEIAKCVECKDSTSIGRKSDTEDCSMLNILKYMQRQMKQDSEQFKLSFNSLNQSKSKVKSSLAAVVARLTVLEDENNKFREECEELKIKNAALVRSVNELEDSVIEQEQCSRVANLKSGKNNMLTLYYTKALTSI